MQFHLTEKKKRWLWQSRPAQNKKAKLSGETASPLLNELPLTVTWSDRKSNL